MEAAEAAGGIDVADNYEWPCPALLSDADVLRRGVTNLVANSGHLIYTAKKGGKNPMARLKEGT